MEVDYDNIYLNKLPITAATGDSAWNHYALVESSWGERKILLKIVVFSPIYNTPLSFLSEIDHEVLQQTAIRLERTLEEFLAETKVALCTDGGASGFSYSVEDNNFVWRKIGGPLTVTYGSVILLRSPCLLSDVLQNSINVQSHLRGVVQQRNRILLELKDEHEELLEFQRQQEEDNRMYEIELITKCISILNEKKEVINHMKKQLADDDDDDDDDDEDDADANNTPVAAPQPARTDEAAPGEGMSGSKPHHPDSFSDSDAFDSPLHDQQEELEHNLPKRTKFLVAQQLQQQLHQRSSTSTSKDIRNEPTSSGGGGGGEQDNVYSKDTEELLQNM